MFFMALPGLQGTSAHFQPAVGRGCQRDHIGALVVECGDPAAATASLTIATLGA